MSLSESLPTVLTASQAAALEYVATGARARSTEAKQQIEHILRMSNIDPENFERAIAQLKTHGRVALHFHPDRPGPDDRSVAAALFEDGIYRSQFETGISNGGVSAHPGGARQRWETQIFGEAYDQPESNPTERPKYGALDIMLHPDGPSPRFGSCYFLLAPSVSKRCTFTYLDSHENPDEKGTYEVFDDIASALLAEAFASDFALGERNLTPTRIIEHLTNRISHRFVDPSTLPQNRNLNHYIEAQVHGDVSLEHDTEILVADPAFAGTETGRILEALCLRYEIVLYWHAGFALALEDVPLDFRGPTMPSLAQRITTGGYVDVQMIGQTAVALKNDPDAFADRGTYDEVLQELKLLWHVLVRYGRPARDFKT